MTAATTMSKTLILMVDCVNCGNVRCMDCVFRFVHFDCHDDCPFCCYDTDDGISAVDEFRNRLAAIIFNTVALMGDGEPLLMVAERAAGKAVSELGLSVEWGALGDWRMVSEWECDDR